MKPFRHIADLAEAFVAARSGQTGPTMGTFYSQMKVGPYPEIFSASEVGENARDVMERAKEQVVLIDDSDSTVALEPWKTWAVERRMTAMLEELIPRRAKGVADLKDVVSDWSSTGDLTEGFYAVFDTKERQPRAHFTATDVHRRYRTVLDAAKEHPVFVNHKGDLLAFDLWPRRQFDQSVASILHDVLQFHATRELAGDRPARSWARATPYPWVAALPEAELDAFASDLMPYLLESVRRRSLEGFLGNLASWQTAAQVHASSLLQEALVRAGAAEQSQESGATRATVG